MADEQQTQVPPPSEAEGDTNAATRENHPNFWVRQWHGWVKPIGLTLLVLMAARSSIADWNDVPSGSMEPTVLVGDRIVVNKLAFDLRVPFTAWEFSRWSQPQRGDIVTFWNPDTGTRMVKRVIGLPGDTVSMTNGRLHIIDGQGREVPVTYEDVTPDPQPVITIEREGLGVERVPVRLYRETIDGRSHIIRREVRPSLTINGQVVTVPDGEPMVDGQPANRRQIVHGLADLQQRTRDPLDRLRLNLMIRAITSSTVEPVVLNDLEGRHDLDEYWLMGDNRDNSADSRYFQNRVTAKSLTGRAWGIAWSLGENWIPRWSRTVSDLD